MENLARFEYIIPVLVMSDQRKRKHTVNMPFFQDIFINASSVKNSSRSDLKTKWVNNDLLKIIESL